MFQNRPLQQIDHDESIDFSIDLLAVCCHHNTPFSKVIYGNPRSRLHSMLSLPAYKVSFSKLLLPLCSATSQSLLQHHETWGKKGQFPTQENVHQNWSSISVKTSSIYSRAGNRFLVSIRKESILSFCCWPTEI